MDEPFGEDVRFRKGDDKNWRTYVNKCPKLIIVDLYPNVYCWHHLREEKLSEEEGRRHTDMHTLTQVEPIPEVTRGENYYFVFL